MTRSGGRCTRRCCITAEGGDLPAGADNRPIKVGNPPVRADARPVGVGNPPAGADDCPVGVGNPPVGSDDCPVGSDSSATRVGERTIRVVSIATAASYRTAGDGDSLAIGANDYTAGHDDSAIRGGVSSEGGINLRKCR